MMKMMMMMKLRMLVVVVVMVMIVVERAEGKVDYDCIFGPVFSVEQDGNMVHFCALDSMTPPFMQQGEYKVAVHNNGICYECICESDIGKACCEIPSCPVNEPGK